MQAGHPGVIATRVRMCVWDAGRRIERESTSRLWRMPDSPALVDGIKLGVEVKAMIVMW